LFLSLDGAFILTFAEQLSVDLDKRPQVKLHSRNFMKLEMNLHFKLSQQTELTQSNCQNWRLKQETKYLLISLLSFPLPPGLLANPVFSKKSDEVEPRFNEVPRDWGNWFVMSKFCPYIKLLLG